LKITVYDRVDLFEELEAEWNELVQRSTANRIFSTWEWQSTWWDVYSPGHLWVITCRDQNDRLIGIAPWFITDTEDRGRVVSIIGCKEVTDYLDLIVDRDAVDAVLQCLSSFLYTNASKYDLLEFCNVPEESITCQQLPNFLRQCHFRVEISHEDVCPVIDLPASWEGYLQSLDKKQRHELRRKMRRSHGANSGIDWYIVPDDSDIDREMEHFTRLMAASDASKARFLENPQNLSFFKAIAPVLMRKGWLQLSFLTIDGNRAAAYMNFDYNRSILVYNSGLLPDEYGHLSPGIILLAYNIRHAIESGYTVFDFLQGDETYKYRMGGKNTHVYNLKVRLL
jgi:CelD/BcsL family acetyltransferase involved in cellulose biosynthesis